MTVNAIRLVLNSKCMDNLRHHRRRRHWDQWKQHWRISLLCPSILSMPLVEIMTNDYCHAIHAHMCNSWSGIREFSTEKVYFAQCDLLIMVIHINQRMADRNEKITKNKNGTVHHGNVCQWNFIQIQVLYAGFDPFIISPRLKNKYFR